MTVQIVVTFMDDSERFFPIEGRGHWTVRSDYGVPTLIIGGRPPRVEIPLAGVKYYAIEPLPARPNLAEAMGGEDRAPGVVSVAQCLAEGVRCPGCNRPYASQEVTCHHAPAGGWVCERATEAEPPPLDRCDASVTQRGQRWQCESPAGHHPAEGHVSRAAELVWWGAVEVIPDGR